MSEGMKALYRVSLVGETGDPNEDQSKRLWLKANQNRLNQNFAAIANELYALSARIGELEATASQQSNN